MTRLFKRTYRLTIGRPGETGREWVQRPDVTGLRIQFEAKKTDAREPNELKLAIINLNEADREFVQQDGLQVTLEAGYNDDNKLIYKGDIDVAQNRWAIPNWVTTIEAGDGQNAIQTGFINKSLTGQVTQTQIVDELIAAMGLGKGAISGLLSSVKAKLGQILSGNASKLLDDILRQNNMTWSVQDGAVQIHADSGHNGTSAVLLSSSTGLLSAPERTYEAKGEGRIEEAGIKALSLLQGQIIPGGRIQIESRTIDGIYRVLSVDHRGDSRGSGMDWISETEGRE